MDSMGYLGIFVALIGLAGGLFCALAQARARSRSQAAERWLTAPGTVVEAGVSRGGGSRNAYFSPAIRYSYEVNGKTRQGTRLRFGMVTTRGRGGSEKILAPYPVGGAISVRYNPDNPDDSVLEPARIGRNLLFGAIACGVLFLFGAAIVVMAVRGVFSADVSGHWHVRFEGEGVTYEGDLEAVRGAGPLTLAFTDSQGRKRASEDCTLTRNRQHVLVRCANPRMIEGSGTYSADNFDLAYQGASRLVGSATSRGAPIGTATFTR
jgi:hypothetical protein